MSQYLLQQCRDYLDSGGKTVAPRLFEVAREVVRLHDELLTLGADSYSALYGFPIADGRDEAGEPFGVEQAIAAIQQEQRRGREAHKKTAALREDADRYRELIFAVGNKYEGESRHQTALRYIKNSEREDNNQTKSDQEMKAS